MSNLKILYAGTEVNPFLSTSKLADLLRALPLAMQDRGMEIRIFVPRFGIINERKNRLHEVVRLSGINIAVGDDEKPLVIKVASIPTARMQVYFIDNDDYFHRKTGLLDKNNQFYPDNDERAIFFSKGVLETVKKLGWAPDIVHCTDWMTGLIPLYLKTTYKKDPIFKDAKSVFTVCNSEFANYKFADDLVEKARMLDIDDTMLDCLRSADCSGFIRTGMQYADSVIKYPEVYGDDMNALFKEHLLSKELSEIGSEPAEEMLNAYQEIYNGLLLQKA